jgi:hypothetical protein
LLQSGNTSFTIENSGTNTPFSKSASVLGVSGSLVVPPKLRKTRNVYIPPTVLWQFFGLIPAVTDSREEQKNVITVRGQLRLLVAPLVPAII